MKPGEFNVGSTHVAHPELLVQSLPPSNHVACLDDQEAHQHTANDVNRGGKDNENVYSYAAIVTI